MGIARQIQLGVGGSGSVLRLGGTAPVFTGSVEATPPAPDVHPTISASLAPTERPLVSMMPSAAPSITPTTPQQLAATKTVAAASGKTMWYVLGALALIAVLLFVVKR